MLSILLFASVASATTPRWGFEAAYDNNLPWYMGVDNESASLAWGESYVLMALVSMFEATQDPTYLDRLGTHLDAAHANRDDQRGVVDYRGVSGACWRDWYYQDEPYCYVVHSGMIAYAFAAYGAAVRESRLVDHHAPDGETYGDKADRYIGYAEEVVANHDDQWNDAGHYIFRTDADMLDYAGVDVPYNQSNAMGRVLVALWRATGDATYLDKVEKLAAAFRAGLSTTADGAYVWNYWGGTYTDPGEDISHAAINVSFAADCANIGVEFDANDMFAFGETFVSHLYLSDTVIGEYVGGVGGPTSLPQFAGLWLEVAPWRPTIWTASADLYRQLAPADTITSAWMLYSQAMLAKHALPHCEHFFYSADWDDQGDWRSATAYGANILTVPPDWAAGCAIPVEIDLDQVVEAAQWDGTHMHDVARWSATDAPAKRLVAYEPSWPLEYWDGGVLFEFQDASFTGEGVYVREPETLAAPVILSTPPEACTPGELWTYTPQATGDDPFWWSITEGPIDLRTDPATGELSWVAEDCTASFTLQVENDVGADSQTWQLDAPAPDDTGAPEEPEDTGAPEEPDDGPGSDVDDTDDTEEDDAGGAPAEESGPEAEDAATDTDKGGCSTLASSASLLAVLPMLLAVSARRRRQQDDPDDDASCAVDD